MSKRGVSKKDGNKKKHNGLLKKKKTKELEAKMRRQAKLKALNKLEQKEDEH